jgi:hypothetical protein
VFRVTEFLGDGCSQGLENLGPRKRPMFLAETTEAWTFPQTATEECCVKMMHIKTRFLVVSVLYIYTSKMQKVCFLEPRTGRFFALNPQYMDTYFVFPVVFHVETKGFL